MNLTQYTLTTARITIVSSFVIDFFNTCSNVGIDEAVAQLEFQPARKAVRRWLQCIIEYACTDDLRDEATVALCEIDAMWEVPTC